MEEVQPRSPLGAIMQRRHHVIMEILNTERTYVSNLAMIHDTFLEVFAEKLSTTPILSLAALTTIFSNYVDIYNLSTELLQQLEERLDTWQPEDACLGDILANIVPFFKMYSVYVKNFNSALQTIETQFKENDAFSRFVKQHQQYLGGLSFQSHLLKPVQRIPRYKLLFFELLSNTPHEHPDYTDLENACRLTCSIAEFINENIRHHEMLLTMVDLQRNLQGFEETLIVPGRHLVKSGGVTKICRRNLQRRILFLFSDILIYASTSSKATSNVRPVTPIISSIDEIGPYQFHRKFDLEDITVVTSEGEDHLNTGFDILTSHKSFSVVTANQDERLDWMEAIRSAKQALLEARSSMQERRLPPKRSVSEPLPRLRPDDVPTIEDYSAPIWIPDAKADRCMLCNEPFHALFRRKHHCRVCGRLVCYACSTRSFRIEKATDDESDRVERACDTCWNGLWGQNVDYEKPLTDKNQLPSPPLTPVRRLSSYFLATPPPLPSPNTISPSAKQSLQLCVQSPSSPMQRRHSSGEIPIVAALSEEVDMTPTKATKSGHRRESADMSGQIVDILGTPTSNGKTSLNMYVSRPSLVLETHVEVEDEASSSPTGLTQVQVKVQTSTPPRISPRKSSLSSK